MKNFLAWLTAAAIALVVVHMLEQWGAFLWFL